MQKIKILLLVLFFLFYISPSFVFADNADPVNSSITKSTDSIPADGKTTATISVTVKDAQKNSLGGDHITLTSTSDPGLIINDGAVGAGNHTASTDSNGKVDFTVKSKNLSPSTNTFTVTDVSSNPAVTLGSVWIKFTASPLVPDDSCKDKAPDTAPVLKSAVSSSGSQITLTWTKAAGSVSYYLVSYGTESKKYIYGNPNVGGPNTTSYTIDKLVDGKTYYFVVRAGNGCAPGNYSNELFAKVGVMIKTPTPTLTLISTPVKQASSVASLVRSTPISQSASASAKASAPTLTSNPPKQTLIEGISKITLLPYIFISIFILGGMGFVCWKTHKKPTKTVEENQLEENQYFPKSNFEEK
ncbi:MAG: fibronectin type III domain-containing protein [Candidatus Levybacteria bacterium]|nr:fibronectin type III domain-containing protein [Candidatus Levybacteria bacterium]